MERTVLLSLACCLAILYFEVDGKGKKNAEEDTNLLQGSDEQLPLLEKSDPHHLRNIRSAEYKKTGQKNQNKRETKIKEKAKIGKKLQVRKGKTRNTKKKGNKNRNKIKFTKRKMKDKKNKPPKNTKNKIMKNKKIKKKKSKKGKNGSNSRQSTCQTTASQVSDQCMEDARVALVYEGNFISNFHRQANRLDKHYTVAQNKLSKKDEFKSAAKHMLWAVGGNISDPKCGKWTNDSDLTTAMTNYYKLMNCSDSVHAACDINLKNETYNHDDHSEKLKLCRKYKADFQIVTEECYNNTKKKEEDANVHCDCWARAVEDVAKIKKEKCDTKPQQKIVTKHKNDCVDAFRVCKKLEDAAVELVHTCMNDHSMHLINQTARTLHDAAEAAGKKALLKQQLAQLEGNN